MEGHPADEAPAPHWRTLPSANETLRSDFRSPPAERIPRRRFATGGLPPEQRHPAFSHLMSAQFDTASLSNDFDADLTVYGLEQAHMVVGWHEPQRLSRIAERCAADGIDYIYVTLYRTGGAVASAGAGAVYVGPGDISFCDLRRPAEIEQFGRQDDILFAVRQPELVRFTGEIEDIGSVVMGPADNALLANHLRNLAGSLDDLPATAAPAITRATLELIAVSLGLARGRRRPLLDPAEATLARVRAWIDQHLHDAALKPAGVADALGLSRTALYALFEGEGGVAQYIWNRRLAGVENALADPVEQRSIFALALDWGFTSEAHFSRVFRAAYGMTPSDLRRRARAKVSAAGPERMTRGSAG